MLAHGDVDEGVDDRVDEGEEKEDNAVVIHRVRELQEAQLQQSLHYKPKKQARKLGRCDSYLRNLKTLLTDSLTHPIRQVGARRCNRI